MHQPGQPSDGVLIKTECLAHFTGRGSSPVSNDVGSHRRPQFSVAFVDVLNRALALVSTGQIKIDVRPLTTLLGKKSLEQKFHADRINRGNSQAITDGAIGRRASSLNQDSLSPAKLHDVPNDQEIAFELEFFDQR